MADEQRITGRNTTTVIGGTVSVVMGGPSLPEDPSRWRSERIGYDALLRRYGWTSADQYDEAKTLGLPKDVTGAMTRNALRWKVEHLDQWDDRIRNQAARLPKKR